MEEELLVDSVELADELARVAKALHEPKTVEGTLQAIVDAAAELVPSAELAAVAYKQRGAVIPRVQTSPLVTAIDDLQTELMEGPCLLALDGADEVVVLDLSVDGRWPRFGPEAVRLGVHSALSHRLSVGDRTVGTLSLFARPPGAFDTDEARALAGLFASHAAVALSGASREANLTTALSTRDVIGQAKGVLMERHGLDAEQAFAALTRLSQTRHLKLAEIAENVAATAGRTGAGAPPGPAPEPTGPDRPTEGAAPA